MTDAASLDQIFRNLRSWARLPKYALERRLDVFLTPLLVSFLSYQLRDEVDTSDMELVVPEFPIKHEEDSHRTVNADYLLYLPRARHPWLLVELKTDSSSVKARQYEIYKDLHEHGRSMSELVGHLRAVRSHSKSVHRVKYARLIRSICLGTDPSKPVRPLTGLIDFRYLAPPNPKSSSRKKGEVDIPPEKLIPLGKLREWSAPVEHGRLHGLVVELVSQILRDEAGEGPEDEELRLDRTYDAELSRLSHRPTTPAVTNQSP